MSYRVGFEGCRRRRMLSLTPLDSQGRLTCRVAQTGQRPLIVADYHLPAFTRLRGVVSGRGRYGSAMRSHILHVAVHGRGSRNLRICLTG